MTLACQQDIATSDQDGNSVRDEELNSKTAGKKTSVVKPEVDNPADFLREYGRNNKSNKVVVHTDFGDITIRLYRNTPLHKANFIFLASQGYFNGTWFHRVSPGHVIQGGNNDEKETVKKRQIIGEYLVPNELDADNYHKRGAVAAARPYGGNPDKNSDPYEFYIVLGKKYSPRELELLAEKEEFSLTDKQREIYTQFPGAPHLDGEHTVFGEVINGMDVVDAISKVETDEGEWPLNNIVIKVDVID